jgi:hypothetical protein
MRIVSNDSFKHNSAFLFSTIKDEEKAIEKNMKDENGDASLH